MAIAITLKKRMPSPHYSDLGLHFTDGTNASFILHADPEVEFRYYVKDAGLGLKIKTPFVGESQ